MEKFKQIEDQLLSLVIGCINDKKFMTEPKPTDEHEWVHNSHQNIKTGVRVRDVRVCVIESYDDYDKYIKSDYRMCKQIRLAFENQPKIEIYAEQISHQENIFNRKQTYNRESGSIIGRFINLFRSKTYTKDIVENIITRIYGYKLVCGEFKISLTDEEVDDLVKLYETNIVLFKKEKEVLEIENRIKKYVK